jgi:hypothetical protein
MRARDGDVGEEGLDLAVAEHVGESDDLGRRRPRRPTSPRARVSARCARAGSSGNDGQPSATQSAMIPGRSASAYSRYSTRRS